MIEKIQLETRKGKKVMGRRVTVASTFSTSMGNVWNKIQDVDTLKKICKPKASFIACDDSSPIWKEGKSFVFRLYLHRIIPVGKHTINIIKMDKPTGEIDTMEYNTTVTIWNHYIKMEEVAPNQTQYTDTVDLYAGFMTSLTAWWTLRFYRHRQRKWQEIAKNM